MSNAESVIFNSDSLEFRGSLSRTSWIQSLCDTGKKVFKYNHNDYNFDKEIIDLLKDRGFIHSSVRLDKIHEELSTDDMTVDVNQINNIVKTCYETNERKYETSIDLNVFGYLIGDEKNQKQPRVVRRENAVQIRFARERIVIQDEDGEFRF